MRYKVLYVVNIPSPYRVNYFNELGKKCDLTVIFERSSSNERDSSWKHYRFDGFNGIVLNGIPTGVDSALCPQIVRFLQETYDYIIIMSSSTPTGIIAINYMKYKKIEYYLECDGGFPKDGKGIKERIKKFIISGACGYFSPSAMGDKYFEMYGALGKQIYRYPFTSIYASQILDMPTSQSQKFEIRNELSIEAKVMLLSVGQFIYRKGFDILIEASEILGEEVDIYIVGGEPTEEYKQLVDKKKISNVHFEGFKDKEELTRYYRASDIFVLPTREDVWGLVINEAMAYGLPIVTTDMCIAGQELVDNSNGALVPVDDSISLANEIVKLVRENNLEILGKKSLEKIKEYTLENMVQSHVEMFNYLRRA